MFENILVQKHRPQTLEDIVLAKDTRDYFEQVKKTQILPNHILFCGHPGTGKTSLAKVIATNILDATYLYINASDKRGIDDIRNLVVRFAETKSIDGKIKIIILDEGDALTADAQRALRNVMEEYSDNVRFILTANYKNLIIEPIRSRTVYFELAPPFEDCVSKCVEILKKENVKIENGNKEKFLGIIQKCYPDLRLTINEISRHIKDGVLNIVDKKNTCKLTEEIFQKIVNKGNPVELRKFVIENETEFNNDYRLIISYYKTNKIYFEE